MPVIVKPVTALMAIVAGNRLAAQASDHSQLLVIFAQDNAALPGLDAVASRVVAPERLQMGPSAAYLHCAAGILQSKAAAALLGRAGRSFTT